MHDIGRLEISNRYGMDGLVASALMRSTGVRPDFTLDIFPVGEVLAREEPSSLSDFPVRQRLQDVADNLAKTNPDGRLKTFDEIVAYGASQPKRYGGVHGVWLPEKRAKHQLIAEGKQGEFLRIFRAETDWLQREYGVNFDELRKDAEKELHSPENQAWLWKVKNAQETLDPSVDTLLKRPPINTIVFDVGGVLLNATDAPELFTPVEGMQDVVKGVTSNGNNNIVLLSDALSIFTPAVQDALARAYPQLPLDHYLRSFELDAAKRDHETPAFAKLVEHLQSASADEAVDPKTVLFIDDNASHTTRARSFYGLRGFTFRGDPTEGTTPSDRLKSELQLAGIIRK
jgi:hypothetical protein